MGLSADPKWDLPKSAALECGFLAESAVGASVWKREEPVGIHMGQGKLSWPIPGPFSAACLLQHVSDCTLLMCSFPYRILSTFSQ